MSRDAITAGLASDVSGSTIVVVWSRGSVTRRLEKGKRLVIGRGSAADVVVDDPSVSRLHLAVELGEHVVVTDLGSSHGTRVEGAPLAPHSPMVLPAVGIAEIGAATVIVKGSAPDDTGSRDRREAATHLDSLVRLVAPSNLSVIVTGETGVGKGVLAKRIHDTSPRARAPFVSVVCNALPEAILESELFGHERGAFTGATTARPGLAESAHGGTLFLDEIGEVPLATQVKLLRLVENREVVRLGERRPRSVDVRIVVATHRDLPRMVAAGSFREDLYFRLNGLTIEVPPLRERRDELLALATRFLAEACARLGAPVPRLSDEATSRLVGHAFPGNVRELRNVMERAALLCRGPVVTSTEISIDGRVGAPGRPEPEPVSIERSGGGDAEEARIRDALEKTAHNQTKAAKLLGISRRTLLRRLDDYGFFRPRKDPSDDDAT